MTCNRMRLSFYVIRPYRAVYGRIKEFAYYRPRYRMICLLHSVKYYFGTYDSLYSLCTLMPVKNSG